MGKTFFSRPDRPIDGWSSTSTSYRARRTVVRLGLVARALALTALLAMAGFASLGAQGACDTCRINLTHRFNLEGRYVNGMPQSAVRLASGAILVVRSEGVPLVFDGRGKMVRELGKRGQGPGEFVAPGRVRVGSGDTVFIKNGRRFEVFSPTLEFVRSIPVDVPAYDFLPMGQSIFVFGLMDEHLLHVVENESGKVRRSFAPITDPTVRVYRLGPGSDSIALWALNTERGLSTWTVTGSERRIAIPEAKWFVTRPAKVVSIVRDMRLIGNDVWMITSVPAEGADQLLPRFAREGAASNLPVDRLWDSMIEVFDARTGLLLAASRVPGYVTGFLDARYVMKYSVTADDLPRLDVFELSFSGR